MQPSERIICTLPQGIMTRRSTTTDLDHLDNLGNKSCNTCWRSYIGDKWGWQRVKGGRPRRARERTQWKNIVTMFTGAI